MWTVVAKAAAQKTVKKKLAAKAGGKRKKSSWKKWVVGGILLLFIGSSAIGFLLFFTLLTSVLGVGGSTTADRGDTSVVCGISRDRATADRQGSPAPEGAPDAGQDIPDSSGFTFPMRKGTYTVSSGWGMRGGQLHNGVDFAADAGTPIYAPAAGVVQPHPEDPDGYGNYIVLRSSIDGKIVDTVYGHMFDDGVLAHPGDRVSAGQLIAKVGSAGSSTGPHLHFALHPGGLVSYDDSVDPLPWLAGEPADAGAPPAPEAGEQASTVAVTTADCLRGGLAEGSVPPEYRAIILRAGATCPAVRPAILAADLEWESHWDFEAVSQGNGVDSGGAQGIAQFMPGTWAAFGVDSGLDDKGKQESPDDPDPFNPYDSILSQANYMCHIAEMLQPHIDSGDLSGDPTELILAAYNAGEGAVIAYGGIPPFPQTMVYVPGVMGLIPKFEDKSQPAPGGAGQPVTVPGASEFGRKVIEAATSQNGLPYVWGGGNSSGPTTGLPPSPPDLVGFDCAGLIRYAVSQASGGAVTPTGTTWSIVNQGQPVAVDDIRPGDAIFSNSTGHVSIWMGNGKVVEAADFGVPVGVHDFDLSRAEDIRRYG